METKRAVIVDTELGMLKYADDVEKALKEYGLMANPEKQEPASGVATGSLQAFQEAFFKGDVESCKQAISDMQDEGTKAAMKRLMPYI